MGVPKFYRWLSERYPLINQPIDDVTLLPDVDNLYLDLNGSIHNATHGDGVSKKLSEREVMLSLMTAIDDAMKLVKPRQLLYLAVDGVAPRAKMNQQRSRRFRAARDLAEAHKDAVAKGEDIGADEVFDSNCITPGTEFMAAVSAHLKYFVRRMVKEDPVWQRVTVIFSGHEVPGEGEHKIVDYIRKVKMTAGYNPNTRHCMAGLDADLIMLALATHEPHFTLLREQVDFNAFKANKFGTKSATRATKEKKYQLLHIGLLREYLEIDMRPLEAALGTLPFKYDGERVLDDFVLMAALCGNDFLPHLPSLDIGEGAIDTLLRTYRENLSSWGGYLCEEGLIHVDRLELLLTVLGSQEGEIFAMRAMEAEKFAQKQRRAARRMGGDAVIGLTVGLEEEVEEEGEVEGEGGDTTTPTPKSGGAPKSKVKGVIRDDLHEYDISPAARAAAEEEILRRTAARLAAETNQVTGGIDDDVAVDDAGREIRRPPSPYILAGRSSGGGDDGAVGVGADGVGSGGGGSITFKQRYYLDKFGVTYKQGNVHDEAVLYQLVQSYVEALQWVMLYYYRGCPSWGWFYPFHYAPMTSDLVNLKSHHVAFRLGKPFLPFQQLLGCLPAASAGFLPVPYQHLMKAEWSPLLEFYPPVDEITVDMNGKRNPWEGVTLITFIKENAMLDAIARYADDSKLTPAERARNSFGKEFAIRYDAMAVDVLESTLPGVFPAITPSNTRIIPHSLPSLPILASADADVEVTVNADGMLGGATHYSARPRPGCVVPSPGYPTLHTLPFTPVLKAVRMNVFGMFSRKDSLLLAVGEGRKLEYAGPDDRDSDEDEAFLSGAGGFHHGDHGGGKASPVLPTFTGLSISGGEGDGRKGRGRRGSSPTRSPALDPLSSAHAAPQPLALSPAHLSLAAGAGAGPTSAVGATVPADLFPPHVPVFSTEYAAGTTVATVAAALAVTHSFSDIAAATAAVMAAPAADTASILRRMLHPSKGSRAMLTARQASSHLLGRVVYVDWPHLREAVVVAVSDAMEQATWHGDMTPLCAPGYATAHASPADIHIKPWSMDESIKWTRDANAEQVALLAGGRGLGVAGVQVGKPALLVTVRKLIGMRRHPETGALFRVWGSPGSTAEVVTLPDIMLQRHPAPDPRFEPHGPISVAQRFPLGSRVVVVRGDARGCVAEVTGHRVDDGTLDLAAVVAEKEPPFGHTIASAIQDRYMDARTAAGMLGITTQVLGKLTGSLLINPGRLDLGLNLKVGRGLYLPGYVRSTSSDATTPAWRSGADASRAIASATPTAGGPPGAWEYTERAVHLVAAYQRAWPAMVALVEERPDDYFYNIRDIPGKGDTVTRIGTWLKQLDTYARPLVPVSTQFMCPTAIDAVEKAANELNRRATERRATTSPTTFSAIPAGDVFATEVNRYAVGMISEGDTANLASTNVDGASCIPVLGDRIANLSFRSAPIGLRGTVVAIHHASGFVEVVFDSEFVGGSRLGGLCSNGRGALVPWSALLCLSRLPTDVVVPEGMYGGTAGSRLPPGEDAGTLAASRAGGLAGEAGPRGKRRGGGRSHGGPTVGGTPAGTGDTSPAVATTFTPIISGHAASAKAPHGKSKLSTTTGTRGGNGGSLNIPAVAAQVDFYFSDSNLSKDPYLSSAMDGDGWVPLTTISAFRLMQDMVGGDIPLIAEAVRTLSKSLEVSSDGTKVRRVKKWVPTTASPTPTKVVGPGAPYVAVPKGASGRKDIPATPPGTAGGAKGAATPTPGGGDMSPSVEALFQAALAAHLAQAGTPTPAPTRLATAPTGGVAAPQPTSGVAIDPTTYWKALVTQGGAPAPTTSPANPATLPAAAATLTPQPAPGGIKATGATPAAGGATPTPTNGGYATMLATLSRTGAGGGAMAAPSGTSPVALPARPMTAASSVGPGGVTPTPVPIKGRAAVAPTTAPATATPKPPPTRAVASPLLPSQVIRSPTAPAPGGGATK